MKIETVEQARESLASAGITRKTVKVDELKLLWGCIDEKMIQSGLYRNSYRMDKGTWFYMLCKTDQWTGREAISFNLDGFIGIAGWASSTNVSPILEGIEEWLLKLKFYGGE